jgi:hypothetical protein
MVISFRVRVPADSLREGAGAVVRGFPQQIT